MRRGPGLVRGSGPPPCRVRGARSAGVQGALRSTKRQRSRSGQSSCSGRWAWQIARPWWMSRTCAAYISSGSSSARYRSWASSAVAFGGMSPTRCETRSTWRSTGISGVPKQNSSSDRRGLLADAVDARQPVARLEGGHVAEELERVVAALLADVPERRLDARRLLVGQAAGADDVDELGEGRVLDGVPVRRRAVGSPSPPQPAPGDVALRPRRPRRVRLRGAPRTPSRRSRPRCSG